MRKCKECKKMKSDGAYRNQQNKVCRECLGKMADKVLAQIGAK
jgi:uncharacterized Zn ribbon protein